jgi:hypothetical protein
MSEFQRRTFQNACYRNDVAHPKPVVDKHEDEKPVAPPAQPEEFIVFKPHRLTLARVIAHLKRRFGR